MGRHKAIDIIPDVSKKKLEALSEIIDIKREAIEPRYVKDEGMTGYDEKAFSNIVVVYPPTIDWNWMKQRPQQLMEQFAIHGFEVYYCNKTQLLNNDYTTIKPNLTIVNNNSTFIMKKIPDLKRQGKKILLWVSWSKLYVYLDKYDPDFTVYDYIDDFSEWIPYLDRIVIRADAVVSTSSILKKRIDEKYPLKPSFLIPNGCDINHFRKFCVNHPPQKPPEFINHEGPVICYVGAWASWVDQNLVKTIAYTYPNALIVIIGAKLIPFTANVFKNIVYIGHKPYDLLPQYIYYSSLCIIPFKINTITLAANPIKMYEYLASGKSVVSTNLPDANNVPNVYIGKNNADFIIYIKKILDKSLVFDKNAADEWLNGQTWENRFLRIIEMLNKTWFAKENII